MGELGQKFSSHASPESENALGDLDASLSLEAQVSTVAGSAFCYLWKIRQLIPYLFPQNLATVTYAMVSFTLDYYNLI